MGKAISVAAALAGVVTVALAWWLDRTVPRCKRCGRTLRCDEVTRRVCWWCWLAPS